MMISISVRRTYFDDWGDEGQINGWRTPNNMRSPLDAFQTLRPVDFRRFPRGFHSLAKPDAFETPLIRVPNRFWRDLGRLWEVQMEVKIYFWEVFRDAFAKRVVELIFGRIF